MDSFDFDLLGDKIPEGFGKRGRPPHRFTEEKCRLVIVLLSFGKTEDEIAAALGITAPTLRKYYFRQLKVRDEARARLEAKCLSSLMDQVDAGKVSAIKEMFIRIEKSDLHAQALAAATRGPSVSAATEKSMGKKEARKQQAQSYDGKFAPPESPRLIN